MIRLPGWKSLVALLALALPWTAGAEATLPKLDPLPPYSAAYAPTSVDERGLWEEADEAERRLRDSPAVIRDPKLNDYVRRVLCRAVGPDRCRAVRLYILRVPAFNASMTANGTLVVWTGLLLRVRNEAELAAVLGHEYGHFELRHLLQSYKRRRSTTDILAWTSLLAPQNTTLPVALVGMMFAFDRSQESAADMMGLRYMKAAGYRADAFPEVWDRLMAEADATAGGRKRTVNHRYAAGFFASHPTELARAADLRAAIGGSGAQGVDGAADFQRALAPWRSAFLTDQIRLNDFGGSEFLLAQLAAGGWAPDLFLARGELYRERGNPRDLVSAADFYQHAIDAGCTDPIAWRGLGLSLIRSQQVEAGRVALTSYLRRVPDATDKGAMMMLIGQQGIH
jgi:beta-barrel assembly-enhancing protease